MYWAPDLDTKVSFAGLRRGREAYGGGGSGGAQPGGHEGAASREPLRAAEAVLRAPGGCQGEGGLFRALYNPRFARLKFITMVVSGPLRSEVCGGWSDATPDVQLLCSESTGLC